MLTPDGQGTLTKPSLSLLITADVGAGGIPPSAVADTQQGRYDMHLHVGDMACEWPRIPTRGSLLFSIHHPIDAWMT